MALLIVNRDPSSRNVLAGYLEDEGYGVMEAGSATEALALAGECRPDTVILGGTLLGGMDCFALCRAPRSSPGARKARVVLLTAWPYGETLARAEEVGIDRVLPKPFELEELRAAVDAPRVTEPPRWLR